MTMSKEEIKAAQETYEKIEEGTVGAYKAIEKGTVEGYKAIEKAVVGTYKKIEDSFVNAFLREEGETIEEAKMRINHQLNKGKGKDNE